MFDARPQSICDLHIFFALRISCIKKVDGRMFGQGYIHLADTCESQRLIQYFGRLRFSLKFVRHETSSISKCNVRTSWQLSITTKTWRSTFLVHASSSRERDIRRTYYDVQRQCRVAWDSFLLSRCLYYVCCLSVCRGSTDVLKIPFFPRRNHEID